MEAILTSATSSTPSPVRACSARATAALLVALAAVCVAVAAPDASAAPPSEFVGTQSWNDPTDSQLGRLSTAKVKVFRTTLSWQSVEPEAPTDCTASACATHSYRWARYDQMFDRAARKGVRLLPVLLASPSWATGDPRWVPVRGKSGYTNWKRQAFYDFAKAAAARYGSKGTFWQGKSYDTTAVRARYWQVWNEPNLPNYWWNKPSASEYAWLLERTAPAIKSADPSALIVSAGLPWSSSAPVKPPEFLAKVFSKSSGARADYVAIHPYGKSPDSIITGVRYARSGLRNTTASSKPLWITEFGWADSGPRSSFTVSERYQARYLRETYRKLLAVRSSYGVKGAVWFNLVNVRRPADSDAWFYHTGLFMSGGAAKDSWYAFNCVNVGGATNCRYGK